MPYKPSIYDPIFNLPPGPCAKALIGRLKPNDWPLGVEDFPEGSVLVGGAVRDGLLGRLGFPLDLDIVVPKNAIELATVLALKVNGKCVVLDELRDIARIVINGWTIDIARQESDSIEEDLCLRDYRINSIGLSFESQPKLIDPTGGLEDLKKKLLVTPRKENLLADPLRMLRAFRFQSELNFSLDEQTRRWIFLNRKLINEISPERVQNELYRFVNGFRSNDFIPPLIESGLINKWGNKSYSFDYLMSMEKSLKKFTCDEQELAGPLARLTFLISDRGLEDLRFSKRQRLRCATLRKWKDLYDGNDFETLSEENRFLLHKELEADLPALILSISFVKQVFWLSRWRDSADPLFHPSNPIDGNILQKAFSLPKGPIVGELITYLSVERAFGRVRNQDDAFKAASCWCKRNLPFL